MISTRCPKVRGSTDPGRKIIYSSVSSTAIDDLRNELGLLYAYVFHGTRTSNSGHSFTSKLSFTFVADQPRSQLASSIIRPRRSRSAAAYSHQTFPCTDLTDRSVGRSVCRSVGRSVGPSVCLSSALWKNGRSQPAAVRHHRSDGSTDEAGIGVWQLVHRKGYFWGRIWTAPL